MEYNARVRLKRDTSANWTKADPVLLNGEIIVVDTDSGEVRLKIGDGTKKYTQLPFNDELLRTVFEGATSAKGGSQGLVPAPNAGDENLFLRGDGKWAEAAGGSDWNDLKNRPFGKLPFSVTWDGTPTGEPVMRDTAPLGSLPWYKIADVTPEPDSVKEVYLTVSTAEAGDVRFAAKPNLVDGRLQLETNIPDLGNMYASFIAYEWNGEGFETGLYCVDPSVISMMLGVTATSVTAEWVEVKTIDYEYLPAALQFGKLDFSVSWDGSDTGESFVSGGVFTFYKVSDETPRGDEIRNAVAVLQTPVGSISTTLTPEYSEGFGFTAFFEHQYSGGEQPAIILYEGNRFEAAPGVYIADLAAMTEALGAPISGVTLSWMVVKKIDPAYLPNVTGGYATEQYVDERVRNIESKAENAETVAENAETVAENAGRSVNDLSVRVYAVEAKTSELDDRLTDLENRDPADIDIDQQVAENISSDGTQTRVALDSVLDTKVSDDIGDTATPIGSAINSVIAGAMASGGDVSGDHPLDCNVSSNIADPGTKTRQAIDDLIDGVVASKAGKKERYSYVIQTVEWNSGSQLDDYPYYYDIPASVTANDIANVIIALESQAVASACGICPTNDAENGYIRIWSKRIPQSNISVEYTIDQGKET